MCANRILTGNRVRLGLACAAAGSVSALADLPISGMPVPELAVFDEMMVDFMETNDIEAGLLGIMKDGVIVYQRGFGWKDAGHATTLRHDALMRIASVTKPFTAAAIQRLYASNQLDPDDVVFDVGQAGGGIMPYAAFPSLQDSRMGEITVQQILSHSSGLPTNNGNDPMFREIEIADDFNDAGIPVGYPPGRVRTTQWVLGGTLASDPDAGIVAYSNFGFQVLGQVVEAVSGMSHIDFVRERVLGPIDWLPVTEVVAGRTFESDLDPREPWYDNNEMATNVFNPDGDPVRRPHGGYEHELHFASGAIVSSTTALLHLAENYYVQAENFNAGQATTYGALTNGVRATRSHGGLLWGTEAWVRQRSDGVNFVVIFNKGTVGTTYALDMRDLIDAELDAGTITWPTQGVDGQWVDFTQFFGGSGAYERPWRLLGIALSASPAKATLNFKPGTSSWTGTINQRVRMRAPEGGVVRIGQL